MQKLFFSLLFFDLPFWRNPNFGNFYWFSIGFLLENQVKITKTWSFQNFQFAAVTKWEALFANPPCRLCTSHLGTGLTLTRISIDCLVIEKFKYPQRGSEWGMSTNVIMVILARMWWYWRECDECEWFLGRKSWLWAIY